MRDVARNPLSVANSSAIVVPMRVFILLAGRIGTTSSPSVITIVVKGPFFVAFQMIVFVGSCSPMPCGPRKQGHGQG